VVTSEVGLIDIIKKFGFGLIVNGNAKIMGESLEMLLADMLLMHKIEVNGKKTVGEQFA